MAEIPKTSNVADQLYWLTEEIKKTNEQLKAINETLKQKGNVVVSVNAGNP